MTTMTCEHENRTSYRADGDTIARFWECDACGQVEPMGERALDWTRLDVAKCVRCGQSARFGGPLEKRSGFLGSFLVHKGC